MKLISKVRVFPQTLFQSGSQKMAIMNNLTEQPFSVMRVLARDIYKDQFIT